MTLKILRREGRIMTSRRDRIARAIHSFVENPLTNLAKGTTLLFIGLSDASHTFREDVAHGQLRVGHGLVIIGVFSILDALPHLIEGLEAGSRFLDHLGKDDRSKRDDAGG